jgi:hypothetical protein
LEKLPTKDLFPVLDIYRLLLSQHKDSVKYSMDQQGFPFKSIIPKDVLTKLFSLMKDWSSLSEANMMMILRCLCNLFSEKIGIQFLKENEKIYELMLNVCVEMLSSKSSKVKLVRNYFIYFQRLEFQ